MNTRVRSGPYHVAAVKEKANARRIVVVLEKCSLECVQPRKVAESGREESENERERDGRAGQEG